MDILNSQISQPHCDNQVTIHVVVTQTYIYNHMPTLILFLFFSPKLYQHGTLFHLILGLLLLFPPSKKLVIMFKLMLVFSVILLMLSFDILILFISVHVLVNPRRACAKGSWYTVCMSVCPYHSARYVRRLYSKQKALSSITLGTKDLTCSFR